jgi:hypothetical protein
MTPFLMVDKPGLHALSHFTNIRCRPQSKQVKWRKFAAVHSKGEAPIFQRVVDDITDCGQLNWLCTLETMSLSLSTNTGFVRPPNAAKIA